MQSPQKMAIMKNMAENENENGNVLWFILITVALLGFLTAFLSRGTSSTNQTGDIERARIKASALLQYTKSIETAVQNMALKGISESDLDFIEIDAAYDNPNCTTNECNIFHQDGGAVTYRSPSKILSNAGFTNNWVISTGNRVGGMGCDNNTDNCRDLLLLLSGIPQSICKQINNLSGITNPSGDPPQQQYIEEGDPFIGSFTGNTQNRLIGGTDTTNEAPQVSYKGTGCVTKFSGTPTNYLYQVLIAR